MFIHQYFWYEKIIINWNLNSLFSHIIIIIHIIIINHVEDIIHLFYQHINLYLFLCSMSSYHLLSPNYNILYYLLIYIIPYFLHIILIILVIISSIYLCIILLVIYIIITNYHLLYNCLKSQNHLITILIC